DLLRPADVETGEIAHGEGAHGKAEIIEDAVDVPGHGALEDEFLRFALPLVQHAIADEAMTHAHEYTDLADLSGKLHDGGDHRLGRLFATHDFQEPHHVRRREEVHADNVIRPARDRGDLVDVEVGRVGGE